MWTKKITIDKNTPLEVARAQLQSWQREHELALFTDLTEVLRRHSGNGLELRRVARTLQIMSKAFEKAGRP